VLAAQQASAAPLVAAEAATPSVAATGIAKGVVTTMAVMHIKLVLAITAAILLAGGAGVGIQHLVRADDTPPAATKPAAPATFPTTTTYKATLKNGYTLELLGLSESPSVDRPWWRADGGPTTRPYHHVSAGRTDPRPGILTRELAIREDWGNLDRMKVNERWTIEPNGGWGGQTGADENGKLLRDIHAFNVNFQDVPTATVRRELATGPWRLRGTWPAPQRPRGAPVPVGEITVAQPVQQQSGQRQDVEITVTDSPPYEHLRIVVGGGAGESLIDYGWGSTLGPEGLNRISTFKLLNATVDKIKTIRVESRPNDQWIEFRNISLRLGVKSDVQIVTSDHLAAVPAGGTIRPGDLLEFCLFDIFLPNDSPAVFVRVDANGLVPLPYLRPQNLAGLTTDAAAGVVSRAYDTARVVRNALITIANREPAALASVKPGPIAIGDRVQIAVADLEAPQKLSVVEQTLNEQGAVSPPMLRENVNVAGLNEADAAAAISRAYGRAQMIKNAVVMVLRIDRPLPTPLELLNDRDRRAQPVAQNPDTPLAAGDWVEYRVAERGGAGLAPIALPARVDGNGNVPMALVGPVTLGGRTVAEAAAETARVYRKAHLVDDPEVSFTVIQPAAQSPPTLGPFAAGDTALVCVLGLVSPNSITNVHAQLAADGTIELPLAGSIKLAGLSESQAIDAVQKRYADQRVIDRAPVGVVRTAAAK
jgi:protein involved in polysaccharide export with SLBB domain